MVDRTSTARVEHRLRTSCPSSGSCGSCSSSRSAARTVEGAIQAAIGFVFFQAVVLPTWIPWIVNHVQPVVPHERACRPALQPILFGLGALTYAKHPEGILEFQKRTSLDARAAPASTGSAARARPATRRPTSPAARPCVAAPAGSGVVSLLDARRRSRSTFAGITALDDVSLDVGAGELVGLIGPERRGQDDVLQLPARHRCSPTAARSPSTAATSRACPTHQRARLGIGRTFQRIELFVGHDAARALPRRRPRPQRQGRAVEGHALPAAARPPRRRRGPQAMLDLLGLGAGRRPRRSSR